MPSHPNIYIYYKFGSYCALLDPKQQNRKRHRKKLFHLGTLRAFATPAGHEHLADLRPKESPQLCCEKLSAKVATVATPCWMKLDVNPSLTKKTKKKTLVVLSWWWKLPSE
jgi:hypothetical protein